MLRPRVIPVMLLKDHGVVKTVRFKKPQYIGDPINTVKLFNDKCADELVILDIMASIEGRGPDIDFLKDIVSEAFMPVCYGGGIRDLSDIDKVLSIGVEKVAINHAAFTAPSFVQEASKQVGSQSIVASIDVKKNLWGHYEVMTLSNTLRVSKDPFALSRELEQLGVGEIFINSIDRDGTMQGYDIELVNKIAANLTIPVISCGGAGNVNDLARVIKEGHASAAAAGSLFVFQGPHRAVLITFPTEKQLDELFS